LKVVLEDAVLERGSFRLSASGSFAEGVHLVTGPVGSGKSTLALGLAGAIRPASGRIVKDGVGPTALTLPFAGYQVTGGTLEAEAAAWGVRPEMVLESAGLSGRGANDPLRCSTGELKRLVLSCVLAREWDLLILDEPYGSLDRPWKAELSRLLGGRGKGITILLTHEDEHLPRVDEIWEIRAGRLVSLGKVPAAIPLWSGAPGYLRAALENGAVPANISPEDARDAACRTHG